MTCRHRHRPAPRPRRGGPGRRRSATGGRRRRCRGPPAVGLPAGRPSRRARPGASCRASFCTACRCASASGKSVRATSTPGKAWPWTRAAAPRRGACAARPCATSMWHWPQVRARGSRARRPCLATPRRCARGARRAALTMSWQLPQSCADSGCRDRAAREYAGLVRGAGDRVGDAAAHDVVAGEVRAGCRGCRPPLRRVWQK